MVSIVIDEAAALSDELSEHPKAVGRATVRAMNRAIGVGRTFMTRAIAEDMALKVSIVRESMRMMQASLALPVATLQPRVFKRIPLLEFNARGPEPSRGKGRGVTYRLPSGRGRIPKGFIATMRSGHRGVFMRVGKKRLPIEEKYGPSPAQVFTKFRARGQEIVNDAYVKNLEHEISFERSKQEKNGDA